MNYRDRKAAIAAARKNPQPAIRNVIGPIQRASTPPPPPPPKPEPTPIMAKIVREGSWGSLRGGSRTWKKVVIEDVECWMSTANFEDDVYLHTDCDDMDEMVAEDWWLTEDMEPEITDISHYFRKVPLEAAMKELREEGRATLI